MIHKIEMFGATCDNCQALYRQDDMIAWGDKESTIDNIQESNWVIIDGKTYCEDCVTIDENDELMIVTARFKEPKTKQSEG